MDHAIDIDDWARRVAEAEGRLARRVVRRAIMGGSGAHVALDQITRRFASLTSEQRAIAVDAIGTGDEVTSHSA